MFSRYCNKKFGEFDLFRPIFQNFSKESPIFFKIFKVSRTLQQNQPFFLEETEMEVDFFSKFLKLFRYRGKDVVKSGSENGKIENLQGFKRFVAKSLKIQPIFLKKWLLNSPQYFDKNTVQECQRKHKTIPPSEIKELHCNKVPLTRNYVRNYPFKSNDQVL